MSAVSMVVQMIILNFYHKFPLTPVPGWLKRIAYLLTCRRMGSKVGNTSNGSVEVKDVKVTDVIEMDDTVDAKVPLGENDGILKEVCKITDEMAIRAQEETTQEEWQIVARVMDRFFFLLFVILQVSLVIATFGVIPGS